MAWLSVGLMHRNSTRSAPLRLVLLQAMALPGVIPTPQPVGPLRALSWQNRQNCPLPHLGHEPGASSSP